MVHEYVNSMHLCNTCVIMWNVKESNVTDWCNFCPAYLVKVSNTEFEIMDDNDNIFVTLQMDGVNGLESIWGTFMKSLDDCLQMTNTIGP